MVDIGDRVQAGQPLAEIEAPELDEQVHQAKAALQQAQAALDQALANYEQGKSDHGTRPRHGGALGRARGQGRRLAAGKRSVSGRSISSLAAAAKALEKAIAAQRSNVAAAEANLARLDKMQGYRVVKAPFDGVITLRNVDVGALVNAGNTLLFRIAQTGTLRTYVNVPQSNASSIRVGQAARLSVSNLPGRHFTGTVARTANSLDPTSRTLLVEVHVPNPDGALLPGMYAQVDLSSASHRPSAADSERRADRSRRWHQVAVVRADHTVHLQKIEVGRDYGDRLEVMSGLREGQMIIPNPGDFLREGLQVQPVPAAK